jgi:DNA polymerase III epsilon subunit-like protein
MSNADEEFEIPFELSRKGRELEQETKAIGRRLASYVGGRLIDRPNVGGGRRRRRGDIDVPTGGVPGSRKPTGSDFDPDADGWVDEGTTRPRFIGTNDETQAVRQAVRLSSGQANTTEQTSPAEERVAVARKRVEGLRAAIAELERSGNWTGKDNGVVLSGNSRSNEPVETIDIDKPGINPANQTREEHVALIEQDLDRRNINDPAQRESEIKKALSSRVTEAKEKLYLAEESLRIQEFEENRKKIRDEQNVLDVEEIPEEKIAVLKSEADSIRSLSQQEQDNLFISPTPTNAYFIHHGVAELDDGIFIPERTKGGGIGSGQILGNTRELNETQSRNLRRDFASTSVKVKAYRSLLQKLRANDESSVIENQDEVRAIANIIGSPYVAFASDDKFTKGWEVGDSLRISDINARKGNAFNLDGIISEVELNLGVEEKAASEMQSVLAALGDDKNFMSTHSGLYQAATKYSGYLDRYPTEAFSSMIKEIRTLWLQDLATARHRRGTSWFGVGKWGHDITNILGPGGEWQVLGKNKPIAGLSKPQGFSQTDYDDILFAMTPRIVKMHDERGYVDIDELLADINEPIDYSKRLSSGSDRPSYPRKPTYGAFIGGAEQEFGDAKTWQEFKDKYKNREIIFFDYETTGLVFDEFRKPSSNGQPTQFGAVKMKDGKIIDSINIFMDPEESLGEWSRANLKDIDGNPLTDEWLKTQTSIKKAHERLAEFAGDDAIFGVQNASFDKDVLELALSQSGITWRPKGYLDTKEISDMALPRWTPETDDGPFVLDADGNKKPSNGLAAITKYLNVDLGEKHHTADADAEATGLVMSAIIDGAIINGWSTDVLDKDKRDAKFNSNNAKFAAAVDKFEQDVAEYRRLSSGDDGDYRGMHMAPDADSGAPLHNLTGVYPDDVYSSSSIRYYGTGNDSFDAAAVDVVRRFRNKPNADVTVYRAVPISRDEQILRLEKQQKYILQYGRVPRGVSTNLHHSDYYDKLASELDALRNQEESELVSINPGDWVTPVRQYAVEHGEGVLRGDYEIIKKRVKAKDIYTNGDSWLEWGYDPDKRNSLSSGKIYDSVVSEENYLSNEQRAGVESFSALMLGDELQKEDEWITKDDPRYSSFQKIQGIEYDVFEEDVLADSEERKAFKESIKSAAKDMFSGEITTRNDVIVTAANGEKINLGRTFDIVVSPTDVVVQKMDEEEFEEASEALGVDGIMEGAKKRPSTSVSLKFTVETKDKDAVKRLTQAGIPRRERWDGIGDMEDFEKGQNEGQLVIADSIRTIVINGRNKMIVHDSLSVGAPARGNGIASIFNARNEAVYREIDAETILASAQSGEQGDYMGATHWARNGFTWASQGEQQKFIEVIDNAVNDSSRKWFTDEEKKRITSLYEKSKNGKFKTNATAEQLVDFEEADELFRAGEGVTILMKRDIKRKSQQSAPRTVVNRLLSRGGRKNRRTSNRLSSGGERPILKMNQPDIKAHQLKKYKYGDQSELGGNVRRSKSNWLKGMTPRQMSELLVPTSKEQYFEMLIDDFAPGGRDSAEYVKRFNAVHDEYFKNNPWDDMDFSPEAVEAVRNAVERAVESNPKLKWAFETHGAPVFYMQTADASRAYESLPQVSSKLEQIKSVRGIGSKDPYVRARTTPFLNSVSFNRRLIIDRESNSLDTARENVTMDPTRLVTSRDNTIDKSIAGVITHEWGHWLHFRALKDVELAGKPKNRHYFGSGDPQDKRYAQALQVASEYNDVIMNPDMMARFSDGVDINSVTDSPMTLSSYGNTNKAEAFAEAVVAILHPNDKLKTYALNKKLREDVYSILFVDGNTEPWGNLAEKSQERNSSSAPRLSSGATVEKKRVKYSPEQIRQIASQVEVKYAETPEKRLLARKTLQKGFQGGFTVELDTMDDIKNGIAVARNRKGMIFPASADFTPDGEPTEELIDTFVAWLDFHGPEVFNNPSDGAERVAIGGWVDDGTLYLDVTDIYPTAQFLPRARDLGGQENQKAVTNLNVLWELLESGADDLSPAFIDTGGDGGQTITRETIERFRKALLAFESGDEGQPRLPIKNTKKKSS